MKSNIQKKPRVGSLVEISIPNGLKLVRGHAVPEYKTVRAKVFIVNNGSIVCAIKGRYGHPYCVEQYRLIRW